MADVKTQETLSIGKVMAFMAAFVVVGAPMVYYLWTTINEVLAGRFDGTRILLSTGLLLIFLGLLSILSRSVRSMDERH